MSSPVPFSENVILVDAAYADKVAFHLTVNFERMLGRRVERADLPRWLDCLALDGGLRPGKNEVQVFLIYHKDESLLRCFAPERLDEVDGKAFSDNLGEFALFSLADDDKAELGDLFIDSLKLLLAAPQVKRLMVVGDMDGRAVEIRRAIAAKPDGGPDVTLFAMEPVAGGGFRQEILGYSLMNALGIRADELG